MTDQHARDQVRILSLTLRILLTWRRISQQELVRAARIAAAEVRSERLRPLKTGYY